MGALNPQKNTHLRVAANWCRGREKFRVHVAKHARSGRDASGRCSMIAKQKTHDSNAQRAVYTCTMSLHSLEVRYMYVGRLLCLLIPKTFRNPCPRKTTGKKKRPVRTGGGCIETPTFPPSSSAPTEIRSRDFQADSKSGFDHQPPPPPPIEHVSFGLPLVACGSCCRKSVSPVRRVTKRRNTPVPFCGKSLLVSTFDCASQTMGTQALLSSTSHINVDGYAYLHTVRNQRNT